ncbi:MAG TPA: DUF4262 domain-containing protein [Actinophytocola sp.]|uniref:DUF4262 domain-containing protein n=1 Tax=Actinophytocola sp. TaxID=1872138 RepID=UPI002DDCF720|nr:DUF4262 domain-containing protein [Actinophytocola sp.]HEV2779204.1 DUF4262 domain-containing protein [Actinophytocola sp.]
MRPTEADAEDLRWWLLDQSDRHGYAMVEVAGDEHGAPYVFSVGAWRRFRVPEAVVIGLPDGMGRMLIDAYVRRARAGERFMPGRVVDDFFDGAPVIVERVARGHYPEFFGSALLVYPAGDFPAVQLIVATPEGAWPWQPDAPVGFADWQPVLTHSGDPESWTPGVDGP